LSDTRRTVWEWATSYVGDPGSWSKRGSLIHDFLIEAGMTAQSKVLNIGCGNLSEGAPIIRTLEPDHFVGVEPNGWLVEAALDHERDLAHKSPRFLWRSDFDASDLGERFDFIVGHSVLSHIAHWQLNQFLANTRAVVDEGAAMLASIILDQFNTWDEQWVYPGVSRFRLQTVIAAGREIGWHVERVVEYQHRMIEVCPNDTHDWLRFTAIPSSAELNDRRLTEESLQQAEREMRARYENERLQLLGADDQALMERTGLA